MPQTILTLPVILSLCNFYNLFFSLFVEQFNIYTIYKSIILFLSVNLPLVFIYKFYQKGIL